MKNLIVIMILIGFLIYTADCQMTKFEKWQQASFFKGFNMSVWDNFDMREVSQEDFNELKAINANLVVIQTQGSMSVLPPYGPNIYYQEGELVILHIEMLDLMVEYARNAGLMYIIAVRDGPGRIDVSQEGNSTIWTNTAEQQLYGKMLKEMAGRYLPDTLFVGLTLTVEPNPLSELWEPPIGEMEEALTANGIDLQRLFAVWIDSVRTIDNDLPLIVGGVHANHPEYFSLLEKQEDEKIIYTAHLYNPAEFSHALVDNSATYPGEYWSVRLQEVRRFDNAFLWSELYKPVTDFRKQYNVPIFIGEFGLGLPQSGGDSYLSDIASIACEEGWHYALWGFNNGPEFNYRDLDMIYGTNYWNLVKSFMKCEQTSVESLEHFGGAIASPNPFSEFTYINYELGVAGRVRLDIYNYLGEKITTLVDEWQEAGRHSAVFDVGVQNFEPLQSGMYFYVHQAGDRTESGKMILIR